MSTGDEEAIINETAALGEDWNRGDAKAAAAFFTEAGARVGAFGDAQQGRAEIEAAYERRLHQTMAAAVVKQERGLRHPAKSPAYRTEVTTACAGYRFAHTPTHHMRSPRLAGPAA